MYRNCDRMGSSLAKSFEEGKSTAPFELCARSKSAHPKEEKGVHGALPNIRQNRIAGFGDRLWCLGKTAKTGGSARLIARPWLRVAYEKIIDSGHKACQCRTRAGVGHKRYS